METNNIQRTMSFGRKCQKYKSKGFYNRNLNLKLKKKKTCEYNMHTLKMEILGYLSVVLDHPDAKGKQSLPLYNVVHPLGD